jgi:hypothetical protein
VSGPGAGEKKSRPNANGRPPKRPVTIAPEFLAMFADVKRPRRRAFLAAYVQERGNTVRARKSAAGGSMYFEWVREDPEYAAAFERAKRIVAETAEREVCRRAGREVLSNARLMQLLREARRECYGGVKCTP